MPGRGVRELLEADYGPWTKRIGHHFDLLPDTAVSSCGAAIAWKLIVAVPVLPLTASPQARPSDFAAAQVHP